MPYQHCDKQPSSIFKLYIDEGSNLHLTHINQILKYHFEIESPEEAVTWLENLSLPKAAATMISYIHSLAQLFQNTVGIASFDKATVLEFLQHEKNSKLYEVTLAIPHPEKTPQKALLASLKLAMSVLFQLKKNIPNVPQELLDSLTADELQKKINYQTSGKSTIPILKAAFEQDITFINHGSGLFQLGTGCYARLFDRSSFIGDSAIGAKISQNKWLTHKIFKPLGYPFPNSAAIGSAKEAAELFKKWGEQPVVIKPQNLDRGEGITINLNNAADINQAFEKARALSPLVMMEEMVIGTCHRIFVAQGRVLFVTKRNPKHVIANGRDSIEKLIDHENLIESHKAHFLRKIKLVLDSDAIQHLKKQGYTPNDIPVADTIVWLRPTESTAWGGVAEDYTDKINPENAQIAVRIAQFLKLDVCGLDFMTTDISVPWYKNNGRFLEINYSPYLAGKSEKTRRIISEFIQTLLPKKKHLETHIFIGNHEALTSGQAYYQKQIELGKKVALISEGMTLDYLDLKALKSERSVYELWFSALTRPDLELVILCIENDHFLKTGLPTNKIHQVTVVNNLIRTCNDSGSQSDNFNKILDLLNKYKT